MKTIRNHFNSKERDNNQLSIDKKMQKTHSEDLGLDVPLNYFSQSKNRLLTSVPDKKGRNVVSLSNHKLWWLAAASIALIFTVSLFKTNSISVIEGLPGIVSDTIVKLKGDGFSMDNFAFEEDEFLVTSLLIGDNEIDEFVDNYILEEFINDESLLK